MPEAWLRHWTGHHLLFFPVLPAIRHLAPAIAVFVPYDQASLCFMFQCLSIGLSAGKRNCSVIITTPSPAPPHLFPSSARVVLFPPHSSKMGRVVAAGVLNNEFLMG